VCRRDAYNRGRQGRIRNSTIPMGLIRRHWTRRYIADKARLSFYQWTHLGEPWLTPDAIAFLDGWLKRKHHGIEWGAGRSTVWFGERVGGLISVEHDLQWYEHVRSLLQRRRFSNVQLIHCEAVADGAESMYVAPVNTMRDGSLDFALVDGTFRDICAREVIPKLRSGGLLIIDNIERYLPSGSRSPEAIGPSVQPVTPTWNSVWATIASWETRWTSSGVTDTAMFFKP
jgi:hypothetical protein